LIPLLSNNLNEFIKERKKRTEEKREINEANCEGE
jgi:hypothetical protein